MCYSGFLLVENKLWSVCFDYYFNQGIFFYKVKITSVIFYFKDFIFDPFASPYQFESVTLWKDVYLNPSTPEECIILTVCDAIL